MTPAGSHSQERVAGALAALGYASPPAYDTLQEGISGADTYRLRLPTGKAVLKLTPRDRGAVATARAAREIGFYRELAGALPLRTPRLLGTLEDGAGYALLLAAYAPSPPAPRWPAADFLAAARDLAALHAAYWNQAPRLTGYAWLGRAPRAVTVIARGRAGWQALQARPDLAGALGPAEGARIAALLGRMPAVRALIDRAPRTLCHGDCNPWNTLRDGDGALVWIDWQEVRLGRGPEDLAFFLQRAAVAGAPSRPMRRWPPTTQRCGRGACAASRCRRCAA